MFFRKGKREGKGREGKGKGRERERELVNGAYISRQLF
jgi:hypothetical protein